MAKNSGNMANRNDTPQELVKVGADRHDYLSAYVEKDTSLEMLDEYKILPRIKVIQQMTREELKDTYGEGSLIITPGDMLLAKKKDQEFQFVPVFFFPEWCLWSDRRDKANPMIQERSLEKGSKLALLSADPEKRFEEYEGGPENKPFKKRYVAHLNFVGVVYGEHPASGTMCTLTFSRGEYNKGRAFISAAKLRRLGSKTAPLWSQVWTLRSNLRERGENKWYGIDFASPQDPFILKEEVPGFKSMFEMLKEDYEKKILQVNRADEGDEIVDEEVASAEAAAETRF